MAQCKLIPLPGVGTLALDEETYHRALAEGAKFNPPRAPTGDPNERLLDSQPLTKDTARSRQSELHPLALLRMPISTVSNLSADDRIGKRNDVVQYSRKLGRNRRLEPLLSEPRNGLRLYRSKGVLN